MRKFGTMAFLAVAAFAQSGCHANQNVVAFDVGGCDAWTESEQVRVVGIYWVQGYVSGHDFTADPKRQSVRMVTPDAVRASIGKYCAANPDKNMLHAAQNFVQELSTK